MRPFATALIGCGGFVRHTHLHNLIRHPGFRLHAAVDLDEAAAEDVGKQAGAHYWTTEARRVLDDPEVDLVFIATPHHTHAQLSIQAAEAGKHVYCEKPMALCVEDCHAVIKAVRESGVHYVAGYNRATAPFTLQLQALLRELGKPLLCLHRFADYNPYGAGWLIDESLSGGRLVGEAGHALDFLCRLVGQDPVRVWAEGGNFAEPSPTGAPDSALITVGFPDSSAGTLLLSSVGNNGYPKEEVQLTCANHTAVIRGFESMEIHSPGGTEVRRLPEADKGNYSMLTAVEKMLRGAGTNPAGLREAYRTSLLTFAAVRAIREEAVQTIGCADHPGP